MTMQKLLTISILVFISATLMAQPIRTNSLNQLLEAAVDAEDVENYAGALATYEEAYDKIRKSSKGKSRNRGEKGNPAEDPQTLTNLKIASLSYKIRDYAKAEKKFSQIIKKDEENNFVDALFMHGMSLKALAEYDIAIKAFNRFMSLSDDDEKVAEAQFQIDGIMQVKQLEPNIETAFKALGKNVNSASAEFSPRQNAADGNLYFGSFNRSKKIEVNNADDDAYAKIYQATIDKEGKVGKAEALGKEINRKGFQNSNVSFSDDGRTMYFTRVKLEGTEILSSVIMVSYLKDTGWTAPDPVPGLNGEWRSKHPALGQLYGQSVIFFSSDMPGGQGGMDIYYSNIGNDGSFSTPVNMGEGINTAKDDLSPFYFDGRLHYSTDGKPTLGGYDIFSTTWNGSNWSESENMGLGYNSSYDDLYYAMNANGKSGYIVSNRPSEGKKKLKSATCCDDIFAFSIKEVVIDLLATVTGESGGLNGATITIENLTDPMEYPKDSKYNALGNEFQFLLGSDYKYKAVITADGYYPDSIMFNTAGILDNFTVKKEIELKPMPKEPVVATPTTTTETVTINEAIRLNNIYYDFDDDKILLISEKDLNILYDLLNQYDDMVIELSSHTDSQGRGSYNEDLSQRRAESAKRWLVEKGVSKKRIKAVGYGESVILNHCKNGVKCSDDEHRENRRTEFKILEGPQTIQITREVTFPNK